jgi:hypothetical protein
MRQPSCNIAEVAWLAVPAFPALWVGELLGEIENTASKLGVA